jgi:hypothetical protein
LSVLEVKGLVKRFGGFTAVNNVSFRLETGRPSYHPGMMLKLYIYGYLNRVPSSRRLERECQRNIELIWLTGQLAPDSKTIADFRKDNGQAIREVCREFVALCRKLDLFRQRASPLMDRSSTYLWGARASPIISRIVPHVSRFGEYAFRNGSDSENLVSSITNPLYPK